MEDRDRRILTRVADVRDQAGLDAAVADGLSEFGRLDIVSANAGIASFAPAWEITEEVWQEMIDINSVHPTTVNTDMIQNPAIYQLFTGLPSATYEEAAAGMQTLNALPVPWLEPVDISNAVLCLASDEARYVTGTTQVVDAGGLAPYKFPNA